MIKKIRNVLNNNFSDQKLITVTAECIGVNSDKNYQKGSDYWRSILNEETLKLIDYVQVKAYD